MPTLPEGNEADEGDGDTDSGMGDASSEAVVAVTAMTDEELMSALASPAAANAAASASSLSLSGAVAPPPRAAVVVPSSSSSSSSSASSSAAAVATLAPTYSTYSMARPTSLRSLASALGSTSSLLDRKASLLSVATAATTGSGAGPIVHEPDSPTANADAAAFLLSSLASPYNFGRQLS